MFSLPEIVIPVAGEREFKHVLLGITSFCVIHAGYSSRLSRSHMKYWLYAYLGWEAGGRIDLEAIANETQPVYLKLS